MPGELQSSAGRLLERSAAATALADLDGRLTYVNPAFLALWGYGDPSEVLGREAAVGFWVDPQAAQAVVQALRQQSVWQGELMALTAHGTTLPVRVTAQLLLDDDGVPSAMLGNFVDISAEHAAREAWRAEQEFNERVLGGAGVLVTVIDEAGRFVRFNPECERLSGWRAEEVLGSHPWDTVLPPEIAEQMRSETLAVVACEPAPIDSTTCRAEWLDRDGRRHLIEWTTRVIDRPRQQGRFVVAIGVDITARHAAEVALQRSEALLREAQAVAALGSWTQDIASGRVEWSDQVYRLFDRRRDDFEPSYAAYLQAVHPEDRAAIEAVHETSLRMRTPCHLEYRLLMADGRVKWVEDRWQAEFDDQGRPLRLHGTIQDVTERHLRDAELQRFRHMVEHAPQEVWLTDARHRVLYVNQAAADSLGYAREQLLRMNLGDLRLGGAQAVEATWQMLMHDLERGIQPRAVEVEHRHADGHLVPKELLATRVLIDGEPLRVAFARNIEERRRIQAALVASEAQHREALDAFPGWVSCVDEDMRYVLVNQRFARMVGRPEHDIVGRHADEILGPQRSEARRAMHARLLAGEDAATAERHFVDAQGRERIAWLQYRVVRQGKPGSRLFYAYASDVTDLHRAQQRLSTVTQGMGAGLWECRYPDVDFECNEELFNLAGYRRDDVNGGLVRWLLSQVHPEDRAARAIRMRALVDEREPPRPAQFRVRHRDGGVVWVQEQLRVLSRDAQGQPLRISGVLQDIGELKAREAELQQLNAELEQRVLARTQALEAARLEAERASAAKSEFLSQMSHELRTPLNAIIGFGQMLQLSPLGAEDAEHVHEVMRAGRHLLGLIDEILDFAGVESGRVPLRTDPVSLPALVLECVRLMHPLALEAGVAIDTAPLPGEAVVCADRGRLRQVLLNLLSNAVKYNRSRGRVQIAVSPGPQDTGGWELRITDTGPGLSPDQVARLFQPFERVGAERSAVQGSGIGLALSRRLVELMAGSIGVDSLPGRGSSFWIRLPGAMAPAADAHPPAAEGDALSPVRPAVTLGQRRRHRVLYVEDHDANRLLLQRLFARRGDIELCLAESAEQALDLVPAFHPALLLLDLQLPGLDGHELLRRLRAMGVKAPAVAISANAMPSDLTRGQASGFVDYLTKPLDLTRVLTLVDGMLGEAPTAPPA